MNPDLLLHLIRTIQFLAATLAISGAALSVYVIRDSMADLAFTKRVRNLTPRETRASEDANDTVVSSAISSLIAHSLLLSLALLGLLSSTRPSRPVVALWYSIVFVIIQGTMVAFQIRVVTKRHGLRHAADDE